ncbi:MAG: DUF3284 domain-containing protein [Lactovum sp.]
MEIQKTIKAKNSFIFNKIIESGLYDIKEQTGKKLSPSQLSGFKYKKNFGKNQSGQIKFDEVVRDSIYSFTTSTQRQTFQTRWEIIALDEDTSQVKITENQESNGFFQRLNDLAMNFIFGRAKKKQMIAILDEMERLYSENNGI